MRKHRDAEGVVRSVTVSRSEWRQRKRRQRDRGRAYLWVTCEQAGQVRVRAMIVPDGSPEARRPRTQVSQ